MKRMGYIDYARKERPGDDGWRACGRLSRVQGVVNPIEVGVIVDGSIKLSLTVYNDGRYELTKTDIDNHSTAQQPHPRRVTVELATGSIA